MPTGWNDVKYVSPNPEDFENNQLDSNGTFSAAFEQSPAGTVVNPTNKLIVPYPAATVVGYGTEPPEEVVQNPTTGDIYFMIL